MYKVAELRNRQLRAQEEQTITSHEMTVMLDNLADEHANIMATLSQHAGSLSRGIQVALTVKLKEAAQKYHRARAIFSKHLMFLPAIPEHLSSDVDLLLIERIVEENRPDLVSDSELSDGEDYDDDDYDNDDENE